MCKTVELVTEPRLFPRMTLQMIQGFDLEVWDDLV